MTSEPSIDQAAGLASRLVGAASAIAAQTGMLTALLYYFGWARTRSTANILGLDPSLFGYSTQEYVLRSVDSMVVPLGLGLVVVVCGIVITDATPVLIDRRPRLLAPLRRLLLASLVFGGVAVLLGLTVALGLPVWEPNVVGPSCTLLGTAVVGLALSTVRRLALRLPIAVAVTSPRSWRAMSMALAGLAVVAAFSLTAAYADVVGRQRAASFLDSFATKPDAIVVSDRPLSLTAYAGVQVSRVDEYPSDEPTHHYRYTGLKLLAKAGSNYYLIPTELSATNAVTIALPAGEGVRLEFDWSPRRPTLSAAP